MKFHHAKKEPERLISAVADSLANVRGDVQRSTLVKAGLIAGGVAALTAGSAAISSLRRRTESGS